MHVEEDGGTSPEPAVFAAFLSVGVGVVIFVPFLCTFFIYLFLCARFTSLVDLRPHQSRGLHPHQTGRVRPVIVPRCLYLLNLKRWYHSFPSLNASSNQQILSRPYIAGRSLPVLRVVCVCPELFSGPDPSGGQACARRLYFFVIPSVFFAPTVCAAPGAPQPNGSVESGFSVEVSVVRRLQ